MKGHDYTWWLFNAKTLAPNQEKWMKISWEKNNLKFLLKKSWHTTYVYVV
jgi:hypothetical protein